MAYIPKKTRERFTKSVPKYQKVLKIAKDRDINESDTIEIITDILADVFGYDKYLEITSEYSVRSRYCDIAMKVDDKVQFLMEAKAVGIDLKQNHIRQAVDYGANRGIQWLILTNGVQWRLYRLRFEKPINYDLVHSFDFLKLDPKKEKDRQTLFTISKKGLEKDAREEFYEKVQCVNRFIIGNMMLTEPILKVIRRELRKFSEGVKVDLKEIEQIIKSEVVRRNLIEGEDAEVAQKRIRKFYKKRTKHHRRKKKQKKKSHSKSSKNSSLSEQFLNESNKTDSASENNTN